MKMIIISAVCHTAPIKIRYVQFTRILLYTITRQEFLTSWVGYSSAVRVSAHYLATSEFCAKNCKFCTPFLWILRNISTRFSTVQLSWPSEQC